MEERKLRQCPYCRDSWLYSSDGSYTAGYENLGWKTNCRCGFAWKPANKWFKTKEEAIDDWNNRPEVRKYYGLN